MRPLDFLLTNCPIWILQTLSSVCYLNVTVSKYLRDLFNQLPQLAPTLTTHRLLCVLPALYVHLWILDSMDWTDLNFLNKYSKDVSQIFFLNLIYSFSWNKARLLCYFFLSLGSCEQLYSIPLKISPCLTRTVWDLVHLSFRYSSHMEARIRSDLIQRTVLQTPGSTEEWMVWVLSACHCYCLSSAFIGSREEHKGRAEPEKCLALHWVLSGALWSLLCVRVLWSTDLRAIFSPAFSTAKLLSLLEGWNTVNSSIEILPGLPFTQVAQCNSLCSHSPLH